jgi:hypothetical protein
MKHHRLPGRELQAHDVVSLEVRKQLPELGHGPEV